MELKKHGSHKVLNMSRKHFAIGIKIYDRQTDSWCVMSIKQHDRIITGRRKKNNIYIPIIHSKEDVLFIGTIEECQVYVEYYNKVLEIENQTKEQWN
jgi:hypothetical protein